MIDRNRWPASSESAVDPQAYLTEVITRIVQAHPNRDIDELMPWRFKPAEAVLAAVA